jgi:hypothetical protein
MSFLNLFSKGKRKLGFLSLALLAILLASGAMATFMASTSTDAESLAPLGLGAPVHLSHTMVPAAPLSAATSGPLGCPFASTHCLASINWGGYAVCVPSASCSQLQAAPGRVTEVQGSWIVPAIVGSGRSTGSPCPDSEKTWYDSSTWIGIDGFVSQTVEQTGTASDCYYGQAYYYAWYEFYPAASYTAFNVSAGDVMTAKVTYSAGMFTTTITDLTSHKSYTSPPIAVAGADRDSAEWISESAYFDGFLALTHTNQVQFFGASATINGVTHSLQGWGSSVYYLLMVDYNFGFNEECTPVGCPTPQTETLAFTKAQPSGLGSFSANGAASDGAFSVRWLSSGP